MGYTLHMAISKKQSLFLSAASLCGFTAPTLTRADVVRIVETHGTNMGFSWPSWITADKSRRLGRGHFSVPEITGGSAPVATMRPAPVVRSVRPTLQPIATVKTVSTTASVSTVASVSPSAEDTCVFNNEIGSMIPEKLSTYVSFGHHKDIESILKSGLFAPIFVTGLPGNGKTTMIEQVCASLKREYFRVNITALTDEEDLIGGFRLVNGDMLWQDGPVILAMKRGGVLLLDEMDQGTPKIMCLQAPLEGKPVYIKKINQWVKPAAGFTILATANTKGQGDPEGRFAGAQIINGAMLDRLAFTFDQAYPTPAVERKIILKNMDEKGCRDEVYANLLVEWANSIRQSFFEGSFDEIVTTRRLIDCVSAFAVFGSRLKAVELITARFDESCRKAFVNLYTKFDADAITAEQAEADAATAAAKVKAPF